MVQELVKKSSHSSPEASLDTETGETDASAIARVQTRHNLDRIGSKVRRCTSGRKNRLRIIRTSGQRSGAQSCSEFRPQEAA